MVTLKLLADALGVESTFAFRRVLAKRLRERGWVEVRVRRGDRRVRAWRRATGSADPPIAAAVASLADVEGLRERGHALSRRAASKHSPIVAEHAWMRLALQWRRQWPEVKRLSQADLREVARDALAKVQS